jgi:ATP-dependent DNA helicase RecG
MSIFIKMFDNRLVIESPGGFPPLVTSENIYDMHQPRNPRLMDAMFYLDFVKCAHEGTRRMRDSMNAMRLPMPRFEQKQINAGLVQVTLQNDIKHRKVWVDKDATEVVGSVLAELLSDHERRIINFVAEHGKISVSQAQRLTGKSWPAANKILKGLKQKGIFDDIRRVAKDRDRDTGARYVLKGQGGQKQNGQRKQAKTS